MTLLCREVQKFVSACEVLQSMLAQGSELSADERGVVALSAQDLLAHLDQHARSGTPSFMAGPH
jgi:hypothetical protein